MTDGGGGPGVGAPQLVGEVQALPPTSWAGWGGRGQGTAAGPWDGKGWTGKSGREAAP